MPAVCGLVASYGGKVVSVETLPCDSAQGKQLQLSGGGCTNRPRLTVYNSTLIPSVGVIVNPRFSTFPS